MRARRDFTTGTREVLSHRGRMHLFSPTFDLLTCYLLVKVVPLEIEVVCYSNWKLSKMKEVTHNWIALFRGCERKIKVPVIEFASAPPLPHHGNHAWIRAPLSMVSVSLAFVSLDESPGGFGNNMGLLMNSLSSEPKLPGDSAVVGCIQK